MSTKTRRHTLPALGTMDSIATNPGQIFSGKVSAILQLAAACY